MVGDTVGQPYAYLRKSVIRDDQRTISPETQEREVRALAARHDDDGAGLAILADWDVSGRRESTSKRPGYLELVAAIESGACSAVYSYSLSRLARSVSELSRLFDLCKDQRVPIRLVADSIDTSTASGLMLANVLSSMAQFESDVASERVSAMYATKRAKGERIATRKQYGEHEGDDLDAVLRAYDQAGTYSGAARLLNEWGVKPSSGKPRRLVRADRTEHTAAVWWSSSVAVVVQRERPELARRPSRQGQRGGEGFALAKLLRCGTCGSMLTGSRLPTRAGGRYVRYACRFAESAHHERVTVTELQLLPWIQGEAARLVVPGDLLERPADDVLDDDRAERAALERLRGKLSDAVVDAGIAELDAKRTAGSKRRQLVEAIPPAIDWTWSAETINATLRAMWHHVDLGPDLRPIRAEWTVPEWRS